MNIIPKKNINFKNGGFSFESMIVVLKKEISDMFRDKKTVVSSLLIPMILMPLLFTILSRSADSMIDVAMEKSYVAFSSRVAEPVRDYIWEMLDTEEGVTLLETDDPLKSLSSDEGISVLIDTEEEAAKKLAANEPFDIQFVYDELKTKSSGVASRLMDALSAYNQQEVDRKLAELGIELSSLAPMRITGNTISAYATAENITGYENKGGSGNLMLSMVIPLLIPMLMALGGISAATDLVAGEKERGTFEPLLSTPAPRLSILLGKYVSVVLFSATSALFSSFGYILAMYINRDSAMFSVAGAEIGSGFLPVGGLLMTLVILVMLGMMFASIEIMLSTYARSFKEASTYLSFLTVVVMVPAYAVMMMQAGDITSVMMAVPVMNAVGALKMVLAGFIDYGKLLIAIGSSIVYVAVFLFMAVRMFGQETVLFRS